MSTRDTPIWSNAAKHRRQAGPRGRSTGAQGSRWLDCRCRRLLGSNDARRLSVGVCQALAPMASFDARRMRVLAAIVLPPVVTAASGPSISAVSLGGTPSVPTVTVTGSNFGASQPSGKPKTCTCGDTGDDYAHNALAFEDITENWSAGATGDCVGLIVSSWRATQVVFTFGSEYSAVGPIKTNDQIKVTIQGATDTVPASFPQPSISVIS